eukprot:6155106-Prymnesium_polylepis.1
MALPSSVARSNDGWQALSLAAAGASAAAEAAADEAQPLPAGTHATATRIRGRLHSHPLCLRSDSNSR